MLGSIIYAVGETGSSPGDRVSAISRAGGLSLLARAALTARRAAAGPLLIVTEAGDPSPADHGRLPQDALRVRPGELREALGNPPEAQRWLLLPVRTVTEPGSLRVLAASGDGPPARMQPENADSEADFASAVWCLSAGQAAAFAGGLQAGALALKEAAREVPRPAEGVCYAVRHGEDLREAERRLLLHAGRGAETDGWMDRAVNRRVSRAFTRLVLNTGVTPNQVTLFHCFLGLLGAVFMAFPPYLGAVLGALLFQLSVALDCSDGELARLKLQFSRLGGMLDVVGDNVVHAAVFIAIAVAAQRRLGTALAGTLGLSAAAGIFLAFMVVWWLTQWQQRRWEEGKPAGYALAPVASNHAMLGQDPSATPPGAARLDALINQLTSRDFSVLVVAAALLGRLEWMLWLAAAGAHVFWIGFLGFQLYFFRCAPSASQTTTEA